MPESTTALSEPVATATTQESRHVQSAGSIESDGPYFNPNYHGDDPKPGPVVGGLAAVGKGIGDVFAKVFVEIPTDIAKWIGGDRPVNAAQMMEDSASADNRRTGINKLLEYDFTKRPPYTTRYQQIARDDGDVTVKAAAIRASNRARDSKATPVFIKSLEPPRQRMTGEASLLDGWVRLEAAKALANVPDTAAAPGLVRLLTNPEENRDVRIAAADALKHYRTLTVARALVNALGDHEFGVSWQARQSLKYLFSRDLGYSDSAWLQYLSGPQSPVK